MLLILTVGLPRSGKSTWAKQQGHPVVNPDSIRLALHGQRWYAPAEPMVWATAKLMVRSLFLAGHETVILDATNGTQDQRAQWLNLDPRCRYEFKVFDTSEDECIKRARATGQEDIVPVIQRMASTWEPVL